MAEKGNIKKVRLQRLHKAASTLPLEYVFVDAMKQFYCYDESLKAVTRKDYDAGAKFKRRILDKNQYFIDIEVDSNEFAILTRHPFVKWEGNPNMNNLLFELIEVAERSNKEVKEIKKRKQIMNLIDALTVKEIYSLCNYLGMNVIGMDINDIYIDLLKPIGGVAYENYDKVIKYAQDPDAMLISIVNRAIVLGVIEKQGEQYLFGGKMIASGITELQFYCKQNEGVYVNGIKKAVEEKEVNLPISVQYADNFEVASQAYEEHKKNVEDATDYTEADIAWAREKARELNVKGNIDGFKIDTLFSKVLSYPQQQAEWAERRLSYKTQK